MEWPVEEAQPDAVTGEESRNFVIMIKTKAGLRAMSGDDRGADGNVVGLPHITRRGDYYWCADFA
ncbi:MAG TPA: hypothetical protein VF772_08970 [Terriglobales bacterium]